MDIDWSARGNIAFNDKVLSENAAACVSAGRVRPTVEVAMWGLHLGAASAQLRAVRLDQKRNERATRDAEIGEEARQSSASHNSSGKDCLPVVPHEL
jgi:hypothetical protein